MHQNKQTFYKWSFSHNKNVPIAIQHNKYYLSLDKYTTVFSWGSVTSNKTEHILANIIAITYI